MRILVNCDLDLSPGEVFSLDDLPTEIIIATDLALALGNVLSAPIDGTSARQWSEEFANGGLRVVGGGAGNNNTDGKWFWPLAFGLTLAELIAMSQAEQWTAETPQEFDDYTTEEELTVTPAPEIDGYPQIEVAPAPNPDTGGGLDPTEAPNPDPGTGTNPDPGTGSDPDTDPDSNPDTDGNNSGSWTPPSDMGKFTLDLKQYFPFCIPFDLYAFFTCLNADPVAPVIEWLIPFPGSEGYSMEIDLSVFDPVAQVLRRLQLLLFCVGLAFKTRDLIKG